MRTLVDDLQTRTADLSPRDEEELLEGIRREDAYAEYGSENQHLVKHEMMTFLRRSSISKDRLVDVFAGIARDSAQDAVMRDYALQHTYLVLNAGVSSEMATELLLEALEWRDSTLSGTALRALVRLHQAGRGPVSLPLLAETARGMAVDDDCAPSSRAAAVQVCGRLKIEDALPALRELAKRGRPIPVRVAAIRALGTYGAAEDKVLLEELVSQPGIHVVAARKAREQMGD